MTDYSKTLSEKSYVNDVFFKKYKTETGLSIDGICLDDAWDSIHIVEKLNELTSAEIRLGYTGSGIWSGDADKRIQVGKEVVIYYGVTSIFKGTVTEVNHNSDETTTIKALACGDVNGKSLVNYDFRVLANNRYRETTAVAASTILSKIASENVDGNSPWIINVGTNDISTTTTFNVENITRWEACKQLAKLVDNQSNKFVKLWISNNNTINMTYLDKPSPDGSGTSVKAFYTYGDNQNCDVAVRDEDKTQLWNVVTVKGYGEGTQQLTSSEYSDSNSISTYGRHEKVWIDRRIRNTTAANNLAQKILNEHKNPVKRFVLTISDLDEVLPDLVEIGDIVTIYDNQVLSSDESNDYVVVGRNIDFSFEGYRITLECHNKLYSFLQEVYDVEQSRQTQEGTAIINDPGHSHGSGTYVGSSHDHGIVAQSPGLSGSTASHGHGRTYESPSLSGNAGSHDHNVASQSPGTTGAGGSSIVSHTYTSEESVSCSAGSWTNMGYYSPPTTTTAGMHVEIVFSHDAGATTCFYMYIRVHSSSGANFPCDNGVKYRVASDDTHAIHIFVPQNTGPYTYNIQVNPDASGNVSVWGTWYTIGTHSHTVNSHDHSIVSQSPSISGNAASHIHGLVDQSPSISGSVDSHDHSVTAQSPSVTGDSETKKTGITG